MLNIDDILNEFKFETSRSGGKGGQNVNKVESKVSLIWDFNKSYTLTNEQKLLITEKGKSYLCNVGIRITSQKSRSQLENKQNTIKKLDQLLVDWLKKDKPRKATKKPKSVIRKRLKSKKINSEIKKTRSKPKFED